MIDFILIITEFFEEVSELRDSRLEIREGFPFGEGFCREIFLGLWVV
jgi:hypothetical protein